MQDPGSVFLFCGPGSRVTADFPAIAVFSATVDPVPAPVLVHWSAIYRSMKRLRVMQ